MHAFGRKLPNSVDRTGVSNLYAIESSTAMDFLCIDLTNALDINAKALAS
jgi:hypothetical protein